MERKTQTIIRTIVLALALINQVLTALGKPVLPIEDATIEAIVSSAITIGATVWAWWKNNSVTANAQEADKYLDALNGKSDEFVRTDAANDDTVGHELG